MARPTPETVASFRYWTVAAARTIGVAALGIAAFKLIQSLDQLFWLFRSDFTDILDLLGNALNFLAPVAAYAALGLTLLLLGPRLARLIAPDPRPTCPRCGYSLAGLTAQNCPECGQLAASPTKNPTPPAA